MKDIALVIREKEAELERTKTQIIALRYVAPLLFEEGVDNANNKPTPSPPPAGVVTAAMASAAGASSTPATPSSNGGKTRGWP